MARGSQIAQRQLADLLFPVRATRDEEEEGILSVPLNERRLQTETYDFTVSTINDLLLADRIIVPEFQRKYVWNRNQASRLIESLIIQCPIPVVYLDQEDDGTLKVIDGNQRLMTIRLFLANDFTLRGLRAFPDLNGLRFRDLDPRFRTHIENRTIRCITILKETHPQIKFDVFERLNTGAVQLNPQELRHGLYHGPLMDLLDELGQNVGWRSLVGFKDDKRMKGAELALRFLALNFELHAYEKPLSSFLNKFSQANRSADRSQEFTETFNTAVEGVRRLLGDSAFRLIDETGRPDNNFNSALFDAQMVGFAQAEKLNERLTAPRLRKFAAEYQVLQQNSNFYRAVTASTSDPPLVRARIGMFRDLVERTFGP